MMLPAITPDRAKRLVADGAILVDIREADERARAQIGGSHHRPLSKLNETSLPLAGAGPVIFHCKSGGRTAANAARLHACAGSRETFVLEGGLEGWSKAGLPVVVDRRQPIELQRQVQIVAGGLGLAGTVLGALVSPAFYILPAFIGGGLLFAGVTGFCGMAQVLTRAPWNSAHHSPPA